MSRSDEQGDSFFGDVGRAVLLILGILLVPVFLVLIVVPLALAGMPIALVVLPFLVSSFWPQRHTLRQELVRREPPPKVSVRLVLAKT